MRRPIGLAIFAFVCFCTFVSSYAQDIIEKNAFWESTEVDMYSTGMVWRDINNDGFVDLFISNGNDIVKEPNKVYKSLMGTIPTTATWSSANSEYTGHSAVGDVNDDGYPDFAVANFLGAGGFGDKNRANLYINNYGLLNSAPDWYSSLYNYSFSCAFGDPDGDGDLDLAVTTGMGYEDDNQPDLIYFNIGDELNTSPAWVSSTYSEGIDVTWGDVDNDGDLDLAFACDNCGARVYYNNNGLIETTPSWEADDATAANTLIFGDINGDGWRDLIVAYNYQLSGSGNYVVFFNDGAGNLETTPSWSSSSGGYGSAVAVYDYDNDGDDDLAAGRWWDQLRIYENNGTTLSLTPDWQATPSTVVEEIAWIDIDGDGTELRADTFYVNDKKLFYTTYHPLQAIDSVMVDGVALTYDDYCFDPIDGWVSLGAYPNDSVIIFYEYSFKCDVAISNWDTYNMAFANTNDPFVSFSADTLVGWAPLEVQFTDNSVSSSSWKWRFGDGDSSVVQNPSHTYNEGGAFDVYMECDVPDGWHNHVEKMMILTLADTLFFPEVEYIGGDSIKVPVFLKNTHPMEYFVLPLSYGGDMDLTYLGFDSDSCRTDYFGRINRVSENTLLDYVALTFSASYFDINPPLEPGYGRIINLYFRYNSGSGYNPLDTVTFSSKSLLHDADYLEFQPAVVSGHITNIAIIPGDANGDGVINILDITFLIAYLYTGGPAPELLAGDANGDGAINILDITHLISEIYG